MNQSKAHPSRAGGDSLFLREHRDEGTMADEPEDPSGSDPFEASFPLRPEERARLNLAPFPHDPEHWKWFAIAVGDTLLESYATGGMDFRHMLVTMRGCALGCRTSDRLMAIGMLAERALRIRPTQERTRKYPEALQRLAGGLVEFLRQERADEKLETILGDSVSWLIAVGICDSENPIDTGTLHNWYLKHKRAAGDPIVRGRPPDRQ